MSNLIKHEFPGHGEIWLGDCRDLLATLPDQSVDLLLTDPPYGMGGTAQMDGRFGNKNSRFEKYRQMAGAGHWKYGAQMTAWDEAPPPELFTELFRVSQNQIIWGGNYFDLPPTRCFNVWRKLTISEHFTMAMCEYCWTSFSSNAKWFEFAPQDKERFHPTQKPVALISRQLEEYAEPGMTVLDPFAGSGTTAIAAIRQCCRFICCEKDRAYFDAAVARIQRETSQLRLPL